MTFHFTARRSGLPVTPAEVAVLAMLAVGAALITDLELLFMAAGLLAGFAAAARWGRRPVLRTSGDKVEYVNGNVISRVRTTDVSGSVIRGNHFIGRSLVIAGRVEVTIGGAKPIERHAMVVADAFDQSLEELQQAVAAAAPGAGSRPTPGWQLVRIDWTMDTTAKKVSFVVMVLGELAIGALLIYGIFFR